MDVFKVPKKVNRHVLKAMHVLTQGGNQRGVSTSQIRHQVKYQMRNLVPVTDIDGAIQKSLENMAEVGLIQKVGVQRYAVGRTFSMPSTQAARPITIAVPNNAIGPDRKFLHSTDSRQGSKSSLNPNLRRHSESEESLSGNEQERTRKRLRTNNKRLLNRERTVTLYRARQNRRNRVINNNGRPLSRSVKTAGQS